MVAQVTLTHLVMVRIHVGQPFDALRLLMAGHRRVECPEPVEGLVLEVLISIGPIERKSVMPDSFPTISCPEPIPGCNWVYILQSTDLSLYVGQSCNVAERL